MPKAQHTYISFKFLRPGGLALEGHGRFNPSMVTKYRQLPNVHGRFPYQDYDFDEIFTVKLQSEHPREVPAFLNAYDEETKRIYVMKQIEAVQAAHDANNKVRDEIEYYVESGLIEKTGDTFYDDIASTVDAVVDAVKTTDDKPKGGHRRAAQIAE